MQDKFLKLVIGLLKFSVEIWLDVGIVHSVLLLNQKIKKKEGIDGNKEHNRFCMKHKNKRMKNEKNNYCPRYD